MVSNQHEEKYLKDGIWANRLECKKGHISSTWSKTLADIKTFWFVGPNADSKIELHENISLWDNSKLITSEKMWLLKVCVHYFLSNLYFSPNDSPSKTLKDVFYFI